MNKPSFRERFSYWFDNWMAKGTLALMALLGIATVVLVLVVFGLVHAVHGSSGSTRTTTRTSNPLDMLWGNLMRTLDPGTMGGDTGWAFRIFMLIITIGGLIIVASLIGIISGAFDSKVEELRKGRSRVLENDHTAHPGLELEGLPDRQRALHRERVARQERHRHPRRPRQGRDGRRHQGAGRAKTRQDARSSCARATR